MEAPCFLMGMGDESRVTLFEKSEGPELLGAREKKLSAESIERRCSIIWLLLMFSCEKKITTKEIAPLERKIKDSTQSKE
jgi:hypothetical protein